MYGINSEPPKNCFYCPLCQGEYGPGNEKSYCAIKPKVKLKYKGSRPKECPIIKVRLQEEITNDDIQQAIKEGFANGYEMAKSKYAIPQGECKKCDYYTFAQAFINGIVEVMSKNGITTVEELLETLKGDAE